MSFPALDYMCETCCKEEHQDPDECCLSCGNKLCPTCWTFHNEHMDECPECYEEVDMPFSGSIERKT